MAEFSNPNQQGGQDNKSLVAMMVVFVAVLFGASLYHAQDEPADGLALGNACRCASAGAATRRGPTGNGGTASVAAGNPPRQSGPWCKTN